LGGAKHYNNPFKGQSPGEQSSALKRWNGERWVVSPARCSYMLQNTQAAHNNCASVGRALNWWVTYWSF